MIIVSDTTAISNLIQIDKLFLLKDIYGTIIIPDAVKSELLILDEIGFSVSTILSQRWIEVRSVKNVGRVSDLLRNLDIGEAESIALALELNADYILMDELEGRKIARENQLQIVGTLGVLIEAKRQGIISSIEEEMNSLKSIGFWISKKLYNQILEIDKRI